MKTECVEVPTITCPKCKKRNSAYESLSVRPGCFEYGIHFGCPRCGHAVVFYPGNMIPRDQEILRGDIVCADVPTVRMKDFYEVR